MDMTKPPIKGAHVRASGYSSAGARPMGPASKTAAATVEAGRRTDPAQPLTKETLARIPAGASSTDALVKATGGTVERIGKIREDNAVILKLKNRRLVYVRPQAAGQEEKTKYKTNRLKQKLDPNGRYAGRDLDHVASSAVEGGRMGMTWVLAAFVPSEVNQNHGRMVEKGPVPVREAAKAFRGGMDRDGKHHVTYLTQEMVDKLAGKNPAARGHSTFRHTPSAAEMKEIEKTLMLDPSAQRHLAVLGSSKNYVAKTSSQTNSQAKRRSR